MIDTAIPSIWLGLTIVKEVVELLNGTIEITYESIDNLGYGIIIVGLTLFQSLLNSYLRVLCLPREDCINRYAGNDLNFLL